MKEDLKNSIDFLNKKTEKKSGLSVPENYFSEVEESIFAEVSTSSLPKDTGFTTPNNYFNDFENNILSNLVPQKESKIIHFKSRILKAIPFVAAASIALFISLNSFFFEKSTTFSLDSISQNDIENWLDSKSFTNTEIANAIGDDFLNMNDFSFADLKTENLEDYLTTIDTQELLSEINN
ncbi:hypothetical protein [Polaribacter gangjinensis]|uniref:Uncharacterized protein n=1 Tax=Polaribacter gangjinensis TaxID=574710 RepID=A0A2S7WBM1_9FLAO|nr:hypothetical protein [Polaribacter gangjinensis]PQJ74651.1 hypothetical protein BTO13_05000 [Polaribacter gangjinensis]